MISEELMGVCVTWVAARVYGGHEDPWTSVEEELCAYLLSSGELPVELECGCCELVWVSVRLSKLRGQTVVDFGEIRRPIKKSLH